MKEKIKSFFRVLLWQIPVVIFLLALSALFINSAFYILKDETSSPIENQNYNPDGWYG